MTQKEYMPIQEIREKVLSNYPYEIYDITPIKFKDTDKQRAVYKFLSSDGPKCLKKVYYDEKNLLFVYSIIEWFYYFGIGVPKLLPTKSGERFVKYNGSLFIVTDWIDGRRCDYDIDGDISEAAKNLGKMHKCSYGFKPIEGSCMRKDAGSWHKTFSKRFLQLLQFHNKAINSKDKFCQIYMESFDYYSDRARHAVHILSMIDEEELMSPAKEYNTICHLDYVNKNLIFTRTGDLYVIDFDKSKIDIPVHDIGSFLKRILKRNNTSWDYNVLTLTLENYEQERPLSQTELLALFAFLEFPQKYWKISRDYFSSSKKCNRKMFTAMLTKACSQKDDHSMFCDEFRDYLQNRYNISL